MFKNIPADLLERFNKYHKEANILDFRIKEVEGFKTEKIFYEDFNVLGVLKKTTVLKGHIYIEDNSLIPKDIDVFLEKSRWFK